MKRTIVASAAIGVVVVATVLLWRFWPHNDRAATYSGYVEAEYVMVGSAVGGPLATLDVQRGDKVASGTRLFALDDVAERGARDEADGKLQAAVAQYADLLTGRRAPEIEAIVAQRVQAVAALQQSETELQRQIRLQASNASSAQQLEIARKQRDQDKGHVDELDAQLRVARLPGRDEQINAAQAAVASAQGTLVQAQWRLGQMTGTAPADSTVVDTLYRPGEQVGPAMPVVQLLPPGNIKLRFFVPEGVVARIVVGQNVSVSCDGCGAPIAATVRFISPQAEFTPPVIYSREQRARLVFLVEAWPTERAEALRVGQPVDVGLTLP